jgi:hypothetical protein
LLVDEVVRRFDHFEASGKASQKKDAHCARTGDISKEQKCSSSDGIPVATPQNLTKTRQKDDAEAKCHPIYVRADDRADAAEKPTIVVSDRLPRPRAALMECSWIVPFLLLLSLAGRGPSTLGLAHNLSS